MKKNCAILAVDDDRDTLFLISKHFEANGIDNFHLFDTKEEFLYLFNEKVDIAIIDHYLNGEDVGYKIMQQIFELNKKNKALTACKVIIISGQQDPKMIAYYLNNGAFRYLDKNKSDFYESLVTYVKIAVNEVQSFYESIEAFHSSIKSLSNVLDD